MKKKIIATVVGARPQFVKAAMLSKALMKEKSLEEIIIHSGQHFDKNMSDIFFQEMDIPRPNIQLNIHGGKHGEMTGKMLIQFEEVFLDLKPDMVVVFGDTNTTLAAALAAKKLGIKISHVEAGVRNFDELMPEEINRYLVDRMSDLNFACTSLGMKNLKKEGYNSSNINSKNFNAGDLMFDATLFYSDKAMRSNDTLHDLDLKSGEYIICTIHRASNTDNSEVLQSIVKALNTINKNIKVVLPIHPRTSNAIKSLGLKLDVQTIAPTGYFDMLNLVRESKYVITDSGGLVREAYFFNKPSLLLLDYPLWPELVDAGACINVSPLNSDILNQVDQLSMKTRKFKRNIFGNGKAGEKIVNHIIGHI